MANLNLSEFTEKLFVADADHTFIWDSAVSISKRVSRNSWLNSGTLTSDAPVTISQTWNNAAVAFTGLKFNAAGTSDANSASASLLLDLQLGGVSKIRGEKSGVFFAGSPFGGYQLTNGTSRVSAWGTNQGASLGGLGLSSSFVLGWSSGADGGNFGTLDTILLRDGAPNTLALRNGAAAQTFNVYGTYTSGASYERLTLSAPSAANAIIGTNKGSGGGTARGLDIQTDGVTRIGIAATGIINMSAAIFDSSIRTNYINNYGNILSMFVFVNDSTGTTTYANGGSAPLMGFGGTNNTFPAIARDGAGIKFTGAAAGSTAWIKVPPVAVTALPDATVAGAGARAFVNDASSPTFGSAVTGGGSVPVPVYSTGSAWHVG